MGREKQSMDWGPVALKSWELGPEKSVVKRQFAGLEKQGLESRHCEDMMGIVAPRIALKVLRLSKQGSGVV